MNNNRNNNRRRGRGNRPQGGGNPVNRVDSRARGNAPQMLDKYKKLAQDAQHNGDRVQAEYYLQFADHYYRVLADSRLRQEESRARQNDQRSDQRQHAGEDYDRDDAGDGRDDAPDDRRQARNRDKGRDEIRTRHDERDQHGRSSDDDASVSAGGSGADDASEPQERPASRGRSRSTAPRTARTPRTRTNGNGAAEIDAAVLPPAFGAAKGDEAEEDALPAPAPRRRRAKVADPASDATVSAAG